MNSSDPNQFNIEFTTTADTSGAEKEKAALDAVTQSAEQANEAAQGVNGGDAGGNDYSIQLERERALREAMLSTEQELSDEEQKQIAAEERRQSLLSQRTAMAEQQLEAVRAEAAGQNDIAVSLQREVEIRRIALQLQQATTLSEDEAMALATQRVTDEELITAQKAAQAELNAELVADALAQKAAQAELNATVAALKTESAVANFDSLARAAQSFAERAELGVTSTRSLMGLLNAFTPTVALGAAAAVGIYEALNRAAEKQKELSIETERASQKLQEQARAALDVADADSKSIASAIEKQANALQRTRDEIALAYAGGNEKQAASLKELLGQEQVYYDFLTRRLDKQKEIEAQDAIDAANHQQAVDAQKAYLDALQAADDLKAKLHEIDLGELDPSHRLEALGDDLDKVGDKLRALGSDAKTPADALAQLSSYPVEIQAKMVPLIQKWAELEKAEISAGNAAQKAAEEADKPRQKLIADLDAEIARLEKIRTLQVPGANTSTSSDKPVTPADAVQKQIDDAQAKYDAGDTNYAAVLQQLAAQKQDILRDQRNALTNPPPPSPQQTGARGDVTDEQLQQRTNQNEEALDNELQKIEDASDTTVSKAKESMDSAAANFTSLIPHFDQFNESMQQGTQSIAAKTGDLTKAVTDFASATASTLQTATTGLTSLQKQVNDLREQIALALA